MQFSMCWLPLSFSLVFVNKMGSKLPLNIYRCFRFEIAVRLVLIIIFIQTENLKPFHRKIHEEELWLYKNPRTLSYVPTTLLWLIIIFVPASIIFTFYAIKKNKWDCFYALLTLSLALGVNGVTTNTIKLTAGRPRPDFFWRCFPDGQSNEDMNCTGNAEDINEGFKSFPSGHASFAFTSMGFTYFYLSGKMNCFNNKGRGQSWRLCCALFPIFLALIIAISRTADYHHHWQDTVAGSCLGLLISYVSYYQYYPSLLSDNCEMPSMVFDSTISNGSSKNSKNEEFQTIHWI